MVLKAKCKVNTPNYNYISYWSRVAKTTQKTLTLLVWKPLMRSDSGNPQVIVC